MTIVVTPDDGYDFGGVGQGSRSKSRTITLKNAIAGPEVCVEYRADLSVGNNSGFRADESVWNVSPSGTKFRNLDPGDEMSFELWYEPANANVGTNHETNVELAFHYATETPQKNLVFKGNVEEPNPSFGLLKIGIDSGLDAIYYDPADVVLRNAYSVMNNGNVTVSINAPTLQPTSNGMWTTSIVDGSLPLIVHPNDYSGFEIRVNLALGEADWPAVFWGENRFENSLFVGGSTEAVPGWHSVEQVDLWVATRRRLWKLPLPRFSV